MKDIQNTFSDHLQRMRGTIYPVPDSAQERNDMLNGVNTRIADLENVNFEYIFIFLNINL